MDEKTKLMLLKRQILPFFINEDDDTEIMLDFLIHDILKAKVRVGMAAAWFTDTTIARAIIDSAAQRKLIILNQADIRRESVKAYKMILDASEKCSVSQDNNEFCIFVEGGENWKSGVMHNKYIVLDNIVWTGSYNFTFNARKNNENIIRLNNKNVSDAYYENLIGLHDWTDAAIIGSVFATIRFGLDRRQEKDKIIEWFGDSITPEGVDNLFEAYTNLGEVTNA